MTEQQAAVHDYKGGEIAKFVAYSVPLEEGTDPLLTAGESIRINNIDERGGLVAVPIDADGKDIKGRQQETVFPEEIELIKARAKARAKPATKAKKATTAKAKTPTKKAAPKATATATKKVAPKATAKGKAEAKVKAKGKGKAKGKIKTVAKKGLKTKTPVEEDIQFSHDAEVLSVIEEVGALKAAKALITQAEDTYFTLGGVLHEIAHSGIYEKKGFEGKKGFHAYVEQELGIEYRKARYLMSIYTVFRRAGITRKQLESIGWSKAKEMARLSVDDLRNAFRELAAFAKSHNKDEFTAHIKSTYAVATRGQETMNVIRMSFRFTGDAAKMVQRALDVAARLVEDPDPNKALEYICGEWLNLTEGAEDQSAPATGA